MSAHLTYRPREGTLFGVVAGRSIRLATRRNHVGMDMWTWHEAARSGSPAADRVIGWDKVQELRPGNVFPGAPGKRLAIAENAVFDVYDYPGEYAQRFDGVKPVGVQVDHRHHAHVVLVKSAGGRGFSIHGLPVCGDPRCIVVVQGWGSLFAALRTTRQVSLVVEL